MGLAPSLIQAISLAADNSLVVVRYVQEDCRAKLRVFPQCRTSAQYAYVPEMDSRRDVISDARSLHSALPLGVKRLKPALKEHGTLSIVEQVVGQLRGPKGVQISRKNIRGERCEDATHVALSIELGGASVISGPAQKRRRIENIGRIKTCKKAARAKRRVEGCDRPLKIELFPIAESAERAEEKGEARPQRLLSIPAGTFTLGSKAQKRGDGPAHRVMLDAYELDRTEVSAREYLACEAAKACKPAGRGPGCTAGVLGKEEHPINCVDWSQAKAYCKFVDKRLPTEAEWARAARGTKTTRYVWGDSWPPPQGSGNFADRAGASESPHWLAIKDYVDGYAFTAPVGAFAGASSPAGALNMSGNVMEWVEDFYSDRLFASRARKKGITKNPTGPGRGAARVVRGASFGVAAPQRLEVTHRSFYVESAASIHIGFRCARSPK